MYEHSWLRGGRIPGEGSVVDGVQREVVALLLGHLTHPRSPKTKQIWESCGPPKQGGKKGKMKNLETHRSW